LPKNIAGFPVDVVVLARRVKERMYAPGGSGFVFAEESFDRAAKSHRIEWTVSQCGDGAESAV